MAEGLSLDEERAHNEPGKVLGPILISWTNSSLLTSRNTILKDSMIC